MSDMLQLVVTCDRFNWFRYRKMLNFAARHDKLKHIGHLKILSTVEQDCNRTIVDELNLHHFTETTRSN
jgi:hypothetical protein